MYFSLLTCVYRRHGFLKYVLPSAYFFPASPLNWSKRLQWINARRTPRHGSPPPCWLPHPLRVGHNAASEIPSEISRFVAYRIRLHPRASKHAFHLNSFFFFSDRESVNRDRFQIFGHGNILMRFENNPLGRINCSFFFFFLVSSGLPLFGTELFREVKCNDKTVLVSYKRPGSTTWLWLVYKAVSWCGS